MRDILVVPQVYSLISTDNEESVENEASPHLSLFIKKSTAYNDDTLISNG